MLMGLIIYIGISYANTRIMDANQQTYNLGYI